LRDNAVLQLLKLAALAPSMTISSASQHATTATPADVQCYLKRLQLLQQCVEELFRDAYTKLPTEQVQTLYTAYMWSILVLSLSLLYTRVLRTCCLPVSNRLCVKRDHIITAAAPQFVCSAAHSVLIAHSLMLLLNALCVTVDIICYHVHVHSRHKQNWSCHTCKH
jgi:hypothetical protein